jgi:hypothetical protein
VGRLVVFPWSRSRSLDLKTMEGGGPRGPALVGNEGFDDTIRTEGGVLRRETQERFKSCYIVHNEGGK